MALNICLLLIEDDSVDAETVRRAIAPHKGLHLVHMVSAQDALRALRTAGTQPLLQQPYIIVLDIDLPGMNGIEFLEEVRRDEQLAESLIFVLTGVSDPRRQTEIMGYGITAYVQKSRFMQQVDRFTRVLWHYLLHRFSRRGRTRA